MSEHLVEVKGLSKKFCRRLKRSLWYGVKDIGTELMGFKKKKAKLRKDEFWADVWTLVFRRIGLQSPFAFKN